MANSLTFIPIENLMAQNGTLNCTVVLVNWNGERFLRACLDSLFAMDLKPASIIVVDNGSTDSSMSILQSFRDVRIISKKENLGFALGNNCAFDNVETDYVALLNTDMVVDRNWLLNALRAFEIGMKVGIVSCRQMSAHDPAKIDGLYHFLGQHLSFVQMGAGKTYEQAQSLYCSSGRVLGSSGGSMLCRMRLVHELGGFDPRFFAYHEDADLCMRAFFRGWECVYAPDAVVWHWGSASFGHKSEIFTYYETRNRFWFLFRNFPSRFLFKHIVPVLWYEARRIRAAFAVHGTGSAYVNALRQGFAGIHLFRNERRQACDLFPQKEAVLRQLMKKKIVPDGVAI